jgi:hypothetical protein
MEKKYIALLFLGLLSASAHGQVASTRQECNRRCNQADAPPALNARHQEKLRLIRDQKKVETDPQKIKDLATQETAEMERFDDAHQKVCEAICRDNPER